MSLKILFLTHKFDPDIGGIETVSEILAENFSKAGYEVRLITWTAESSEKIYPFIIIRSPGLFTLLKEHSKADIVFENNPSLRLSWPRIFFKRPLVISLHTWMTRSNGTTGWQEYIKTKWLKQAQQVISCSEAIRRRCWPPSLVIGNPYKEDTFKILGSIEKTSDFIFLGRLVSDKGADLAIRAFHQLLLRKRIDFNSPTTLMTIVGEGPERQTLEKLVFELGLQKKVLFKGALLGRELVECLNQHRFLVVPSLWEEPFGLVALEGMACGCLPIVSDGGGLPDAVGKAGIVFKRGDLDSLVDCMFKVFEDEKLVNHIRTAATSHLASHTSFEVSKRYLNVVQSIFKKQSALYSKSN